eukprot:scaffold15357_cov154-Skeletonema_menzelii.AAC.4
MAFGIQSSRCNNDATKRLLQCRGINQPRPILIVQVQLVGSEVQHKFEIVTAPSTASCVSFVEPSAFSTNSDVE